MSEVWLPMKACQKSAIAILVLLTFTLVSEAQKQPAPARPQTPRQALVEMINGGGKGVMKHLTVEVQDLLNKPENKQVALGLGMFDSIKGEAEDLQVFETGPVLLSVTDRKQHQKIEVNVDNDDLNNDQDTLTLSVHMFRDEQEQNDELGFFASHLTVEMKRQQDIWRVNNIGVGVEFPVGDANFLEKTFLKRDTNRATGVGVVAPDVHTVLKPGDSPQAPSLSAAQLTMMLGLAEQSFARQHADVGFTCSLAQLAEAGDTFGLDLQTTSGIYKGYKIALAGCQGKPAGSFQITVEPVQAKGGKAYCTDATQNVRASDDGRGSTCLTAGTVEQSLVGGDSETVGWDPVSAAKPKN